ncbi:MAG: protein translocase subunit SecF, partial [Lentisphaeria bacterium]|nr:protein translocase subunit SecF [Lentisphaeria bacterium]
RIGTMKGQGGDKMLEIVLPMASKGDALGNVDPEELRQKLNAKFAGADFGEGETRVVGGHVGAQFRSASFKSAFWAIIGVVLYLAFRFEFMYGVAAVVAVAHDMLICTGLFMLMGGRLTPSVIAAIMTILGYSLNDTIVIFDRIRETQKLNPDVKYSSLINMSLCDTVSRTFLTSLTTLLAVIAILVIAGGDVWDFAMVMFFGVFVGTYSSIFIASSFINTWHKKSAHSASRRAAADELETVEAK